MSLYRLTGLSKRFGNRTVLDIDALQIEAGQIYALLGPNGAGKTTLIDIMGFLATPTAGAVEFQNRRIDYADAELLPLRRKVVVVHQQPVLFTTTVFKNVEFGLKIRKVPSKERRRRVEAALDLVGMRSFSASRAHRLSGGESQRVVLARALVLEPEVLLCDEPTASVDEENQQVVGRILRDINATKGITVVFTTHDRQQATTLTPHTIFLSHGRIKRDKSSAPVR